MPRENYRGEDLLREVFHLLADRLPLLAPDDPALAPLRNVMPEFAAQLGELRLEEVR